MTKHEGRVRKCAPVLSDSIGQKVAPVLSDFIGQEAKDAPDVSDSVDLEAGNSSATGQLTNGAIGLFAYPLIGRQMYHFAGQQTVDSIRRQTDNLNGQQWNNPLGQQQNGSIDQQMSNFTGQQTRNLIGQQMNATMSQQTRNQIGQQPSNPISQVEKPKIHHCDFCPKSFTSKQGLQFHRQGQHLGQRKYKCSHTSCGKGFTKMNVLKEHERLHSDVFGFQCKKCGQQFKQKNSLYAHKRRKTSCVLRQNNIV